MIKNQFLYIDRLVSVLWKRYAGSQVNFPSCSGDSKASEDFYPWLKIKTQTSWLSFCLVHFFSLIHFLGMCACLSICASRTCSGPNRASDPQELKLQAAWYGCREPNPSPLQEQQVLFNCWDSSPKPTLSLTSLENRTHAMKEKIFPSERKSEGLLLRIPKGKQTSSDKQRQPHLTCLLLK